jgi:hypothetical protein
VRHAPTPLWALNLREPPNIAARGLPGSRRSATPKFSGMPSCTQRPKAPVQANVTVTSGRLKPAVGVLVVSRSWPGRGVRTAATAGGHRGSVTLVRSARAAFRPSGRRGQRAAWGERVRMNAPPHLRDNRARNGFRLATQASSCTTIRADPGLLRTCSLTECPPLSLHGEQRPGRTWPRRDDYVTYALTWAPRGLEGAASGSTRTSLTLSSRPRTCESRAAEADPGRRPLHRRPHLGRHDMHVVLPTPIRSWSSTSARSWPMGRRTRSGQRGRDDHRGRRRPQRPAARVIDPTSLSSAPLVGAVPGAQDDAASMSPRSARGALGPHVVKQYRPDS